MFLTKKTFVRLSRDRSWKSVSCRYRRMGIHLKSLTPPCTHLDRLHACHSPHSHTIAICFHHMPIESFHYLIIYFVSIQSLFLTHYHSKNDLLLSSTYSSLCAKWYIVQFLDFSSVVCTVHYLIKFFDRIFQSVSAIIIFKLRL